MTTTVAIVVAYDPDLAVADALLARLQGCCDGIVVVDNGDEAALKSRCDRMTPGTVRYLPNASNLGIAAALNRGVATAWEMGATHVLLSDHDSRCRRRTCCRSCIARWHRSKLPASTLPPSGRCSQTGCGLRTRRSFE